MQSKIIAIDYDNVISLNVEAWQQIIDIFTTFGSIVYIVTYRHSTQFKDMNLDIKNVKDVIFTNAVAKKKYCKEIAGIEIDIWIDDSPETILFDYTELLEKNGNTVGDF
jgi:hypothetical protein